MATVNDEERASALFRAFDSRDVGVLAQLMTDDVRLQLGNANPAVGKPAFVEELERFINSVAGWHHHIQDVWSDGEALIVELQVSYTRLDGGQVTLPCCNVFRLRDGLVADYRVYMDINPVYSEETV